MTVRLATHAGSWFEEDEALLSREIQANVREALKRNPEFPIPGARVLVGPYVLDFYRLYRSFTTAMINNQIIYIFL